MHGPNSWTRARRAFLAPALLTLFALFHPSPPSLSAQACLGESPLTNRTVSLSAGLAVSEAVVPGVSVRAALPDGFTVGAGWNRLDPDGEVSMSENVPAHDVWSGLVAMEVASEGGASLCPVVRVARGEWSRERAGGFFPGTYTDTRTTTVLAAGFGYGVELPLDGQWIPALFARAEVQRHWVTREEGSDVRHEGTDRATELMSRFGVMLPWQRWTGSAWVGMGTFDGRPPTPHAAGDPVFGMSLGVSF